MSSVGGYHGQAALRSGRDAGLACGASPFAASDLSCFVLLIMDLFPEFTKFHETFHKLKIKLAEKYVAHAGSSYDNVTNVYKWAQPCFPMQF